MEPDKPDDGSLFSVRAPLPVADLDDEGRLACLRLARSHNVGPTTFRELINHFGGAQQALEALPHIGRSRTRGKPVKICSVEDALAELDAAAKIGATPVFTIEPGYPRFLAHLEVPPPLLYVLGETGLLQKPALAVVGARLASAAGTKLARMFSARLGQAGLVIVSGLARGIDKAAHEAAMETGTIAVVAGGVDVVYPPEHKDLHSQIAGAGCIVSEMPCGFKPRGKDFPRRNRIISGLSLGVLVVEAAKRSGSLVTARLAGEQNREVFAVPGHPLDPRAQGTNGLLKDGATLVTEPGDVEQVLRPMAAVTESGFREPQVRTPAARADCGYAAAPDVPNDTVERVQGSAWEDIPVEDVTAPPSPVSQAVARCDESVRDMVRQTLSPAPVDVDAIVRATGLGTHQVRAALVDLDLGGEIEHHGANLISLRLV